MDWPNPCRGQAGEGSQSWKGAIAAPERHHLTNCRQASLLTKTPWDSGRFKSTRRVAARDQLPRRDTWHTCKGALVVHPENRMAGMEDSTEFKPAVYHQHHTKPEPSSRMRLLKGDEKSDVAKCFILSGVGTSGAQLPRTQAGSPHPLGAAPACTQGKGQGKFSQDGAPPAPSLPACPQRRGCLNLACVLSHLSCV